MTNREKLSPLEYIEEIERIFQTVKVPMRFIPTGEIVYVTAEMRNRIERAKRR